VKLNVMEPAVPFDLQISSRVVQLDGSEYEPVYRNEFARAQNLFHQLTRESRLKWFQNEVDAHINSIPR
jgi:hypothetical protein